jgi:hypothetical protein
MVKRETAARGGSGKTYTASRGSWWVLTKVCRISTRARRPTMEAWMSMALRGRGPLLVSIAPKPAAGLGVVEGVSRIGRTRVMGGSKGISGVGE